jgi:hypothetical protein
MVKVFANPSPPLPTMLRNLIPAVLLLHTHINAHGISHQDDRHLHVPRQLTDFIAPSSTFSGPIPSSSAGPTPNFVCGPNDQVIVNECTDDKINADNWINFRIDDFLVEYLVTFGVAPSFPQVFINNQSPQGKAGTLDTRQIDSLGRLTSFGVNEQGATSDCAFSAIANAVSTECALYLSPQAAWVVKNWIGLWQVTHDVHEAVGFAGTAILGSTFIDDVVDALKERKRGFFDGLINTLVEVVFKVFIPRGKLILKGFRVFDNLVTNGELSERPAPDIFETAQANEQIEDVAERTKDQLRRQIQNIITGIQAQCQKTLDLVFSDTASVPIGSADEARNSVPFKLANQGAYLRPAPGRDELQADMERNLKNWIVSSTMTTMQWKLILDPTELFDPPGEFGVACKGNNGFPFTLGQPCGLLLHSDSKADFNDGAKPNDPHKLEELIDVREMFSNAAGCGGGRVNPDSLGTGGTGLPACLYNFEIITLRD